MKIQIKKLRQRLFVSMQGFGLCLLAYTASLVTASPVLAASDTSLSEAKAPYELKIIKRGEAAPRGDNTTTEGQQQNRRVDVRLLRKPPEKQVVESNAVVPGGGSVWITRDPAALERLLRVQTSTTLTVEDQLPVQPLEFQVETNYPYFIDRYLNYFFSY